MAFLSAANRIVTSRGGGCVKLNAHFDRIAKRTSSMSMADFSACSENSRESVRIEDT